MKIVFNLVAELQEGSSSDTWNKNRAKPYYEVSLLLTQTKYLLCQNRSLERLQGIDMKIVEVKGKNSICWVKWEYVYIS